jgi:phage baseplate assembly protein W
LVQFTDPFLGTGWSFPPTFDRPDAAVQMVSGETDIRESLWILLSTVKGERVMVPDYGCDIWRFVFRSIDSSLIGQVQYAVSQAILDWEPRISVERVEVTAKPDSVGVLLIELDYLIRRTNTRSNLVYPFYLQEGSIAMPDV